MLILGVTWIIGEDLLTRNQLLRKLHSIIKPRTYLEIGVFKGQSLSYADSSCKVIGIDPSPMVKDIPSNVRIFELTSDDFFLNPDFTHFDSIPIDLVYIDGMHLAEYVKRDLENVAKYCNPNTVVLLDDVIPVNQYCGGRKHVKGSGHWSGDVYRVVDELILRSDVTASLVDVAPTGLCVLQGITRSFKFRDEFPVIEQIVPDRVLNKTFAISSKQFLGEFNV